MCGADDCSSKFSLSNVCCKTQFSVMAKTTHIEQQYTRVQSLSYQKKIIMLNLNPFSVVVFLYPLCS